MTKTERENAIIQKIKALPKSTYGDYHYIESLEKIINNVMGWESINLPHGKVYYTELQKICEVMARMEAKGVIKRSKSRAMFKLIQN